MLLNKNITTTELSDELSADGFVDAQNPLLSEKAVPDPEVQTASPRRNFTAYYKLRILEEVATFPQISAAA